MFSTSFCRQSACHWSRPYRQSLTRIQESKSANCESARRVANFWKGVSWAAVSSRSSSTLWPPRDTPLKSSSSSPPSLVEMWVSYLTVFTGKASTCLENNEPSLLIYVQWKRFKDQHIWAVKFTRGEGKTSELSNLILCCLFITVLCPHKQVLNSSLLQKSSSRLWRVLGHSSHLCWRDPQL